MPRQIGAIMEQMLKAHSFLVVSVPGCIQRGCEGIFAEDISPMLSAYKRRRDDVYARLKAMGMDVKRLTVRFISTLPSPNTAWMPTPSANG